ncbi:IQ calmodulin-binding motif-containing protein 1 [Herpailurus yagouaroundi]|uniref:IQ calmodulin-binding motif-containing protein 1 n=1 Tax=Herpailurus yagouaroundi TaxID=1608482 RepID=UPI001AD733C7|nr:IQ calmodulin-binding motif-containing protein 1 [Puma yagouaroundi]XP_040340582.1 IQ calmodulin-binding motif-containing protein 1 [Puma yagouaroundi]XP_040340584.1 IQ calmodulin-binding motif-containing protein 1 [Puma yagouaroundi]XP_040340585.1 IQ calmodulin-binding motif-containing protein 1 [Puma yagouaroundi]XP_040340586.1 IQ calmodulin-binding motif-containing protein 1 [Puma yagouaroundi]XP_040340587.1 IQ calmodulin-binding motif-containing protein 1 [Puma yagouaroundi]XP_04034058
MKPTGTDPRILSLAAEVANSPEQNVPIILLKLKEIINNTPLGSSELKKIKQDIYCYDLIQYCLLVLSQDCSRIQGGWTTISQLTQILSHCCVGLEPGEDAEEFYNELLPSAAENFLVLGRRLQTCFINAAKGEEKDELLRFFQIVTDSLFWLLGGHVQLIQNVLQSDHFLHLLQTDNLQIGSTVMTMLQNILQINRGDLLRIEGKTLHSILDEVVFKLLSTSSSVIRSTAAKLLLLMTETHQEILILLRLSACYKGLRSLRNKQKPGTEFSQELGQLIALLTPKVYQEVEEQKLHQAACLIQAYWKGFQTRKRLKKLPSAVITLQRSFRSKRSKILLKLKRQKEEEDRRLQLHIQRQRAMRLSRELRLSMLEIVHPGQVEKHNREIEEKSALIIQKHWRGYRERKIFRQQRPSLTEYKAAVTLQRATLKFLAKCHKKKKLFAPWQGLQDLTDARRVKLKQQVDDYLQRHPSSQMSDVTSRELHSQAQEQLQHYLMGRVLEERAQQHREALMAQINTNIEQLMKAPSLKEAEGKEPELFLSRSRPVAAKAKQAHLTALKHLQAPWWKNLGEEEGDEIDVPKDELSVELGTLFIGGTKPP